MKNKYKYMVQLCKSMVKDIEIPQDMRIKYALLGVELKNINGCPDKLKKTVKRYSTETTKTSKSIYNELKNIEI